jgi:hypothetical protein
MRKVVVRSIPERLHDALQGIDRPGVFCTSGTLDTVLPGLEVKGLGPVGLPLTAMQARELKRYCAQAPYGKGEATIVDTRVRRVWRMKPTRFALTNPDWNRFLRSAVARVETEFGLADQKLTPHLYDLLLYEKGSFFLPHRDGEKLDRMVATLVVVLPSAHEGGKLIVRHDDQEKVVDFSGPRNRYEVQFAAFYADCQHEVRPLRSGYRLCLVYNLTTAKSREALRAPRSEEHIKRVAGVLRDWAHDAKGPRKLAVTLAHRYTKDGLAWDALKGIDRARATVLAVAARQAGCHVHLALLTFWEQGSAESDDAPSYWDAGDAESGEYSMGEVFDWSLVAEHWRTPDGRRRPFGTMEFSKEEVVPPDSLTDVEPEEDFEGYTGNAGMTLERWYRHAAVILWPSAGHKAVVPSRSRTGTRSPRSRARARQAVRKTLGAAIGRRRTRR